MKGKIAMASQMVVADDNLKPKTLPQTNIINSIVTAELHMNLEKRRGSSSLQTLQRGKHPEPQAF